MDLHSRPNIASRPLIPTASPEDPKHVSSVTAKPLNEKRPAQKARGRKPVPFRRLWVSLIRICRLRSSERPKIIVSSAWGRVLLRCSVHFVPISVTIVVAYLNLRGYFIGGLLTGNAYATSQTIYTLALQVAAKVMEMFTVSSLANVLLTLVRRELVFDNGIPLGMLYSSTRFTQVTYLISPTLWSCVKFPGSWMKRGFLIAMILIAGLLAIFAGPATATLLLPEVRPDWPAGGTAFWLRGKAEDLWPTKLGADHVGGPECVAPGEEFIKLAPFNLTHCIWYSSAAFSDSFRRSDLVPEFDLPVKDDLSRRTVHISKESDVGPAGTIETYEIHGGSLHTGPLDQTITQSKYGTRGLEVSKVNSLIPAVRVKCALQALPDIKGVVETKQRVGFPFFPEYEKHDAASNGSTLYLDIPRWYNTSCINTQWIPIPTAPGQSHLINNTMPNHYSSAYILVHAPLPIGNAFACAVDAKWGPGITIMDESAQGELVSYGQLTNIRSRNESELGSERGFLPIDDGTWTTASIAPEWLAALTPQAANVSEGYTTISSTLEAMGVDQIYTNEKWDKARVAVESLLAATTADGMSRIGLADNPFDLTLATDSPNQFLDDGIAVVRPTPSAEDPDFTELHWAITVSGYAFKADQNAHYLALAVLFVHLLVALAHIAYVIITRTAPVAWGTSEELLVLAQSSPPTQMALQDTCGGIQSTKTFRKLVKVRALKDEKVKAGEETVHMVYEGDYDHGMYEQCEVKRLYGAK